MVVDRWIAAARVHMNEWDLSTLFFFGGEHFFGEIDVEGYQKICC